MNITTHFCCGGSAYPINSLYACCGKTAYLRSNQKCLDHFRPPKVVNTYENYCGDSMYDTMKNSCCNGKFLICFRNLFSFSFFTFIFTYLMAIQRLNSIMSLWHNTHKRIKVRILILVRIIHISCSNIQMSTAGHFSNSGLLNSSAIERF